MSILDKFRKKTKKTIQKSKEEKPAKSNEEWFEPEGELTVDVYQNKKYFFIEAPVAGIDAKDLDITIDEDIVKIKGEREKLKKVPEDKYLIKECYWGRFSREIILPQEADGSKTNASIKHGILVIKIPKIEEEKQAKIKIKTAGG